MRAMRLHKREIMDDEGLRAVLDACQVLHLGLTDSEGVFVVPVNYGYEWFGRGRAEGGSPEAAGAPIASLYVHSAHEGRKAEALLAGGGQGAPVAVELERDRGNITGGFACAYSRSYESVMGSGRAREVTGCGDKARALGLIMAHAAPGAPAAFAPEALARVAVFRIDVTVLTGKRRGPKA